MRAKLTELAATNPDAVLQLGTSLPMMGFVEEAERSFGLPIVPANGALLWHAMRSQGIHDRYTGFGSLFRDH
jgi:maleate isomerase